MLVHPAILPSEAWNTWSERPAEMVFLPLGLRVTPLLYSTKERIATTIRPPAEIRFGTHALDGAAVDFEAAHAGTRLAFSYAKPGPFGFRGAWQVLERGEWALRFWVVLCLSAENGATVRFEDGAARVAVGDRHAALVAAQAPVSVTAHATVEAVAADMAANGYFDRSTQGTEAPVIALRFNLEMMPRLVFAAAVADGAHLAVAEARRLCAAPPAPPAEPLQTGAGAGALDAVRDVLGWNTAFDGRARRPTIAASRIWGLGSAVWFNDQILAGLMAGVLDPHLGRRTFLAALAGATPEGNVACLIHTRDAWVDRSQAPHGAFIAWTMFLRSRERALLDAAYPVLAANHRWWRARRDPDGRGLVSCGTSDTGAALYKGTAFGARNETGMDNSATHDEAVYDPETRTLSTLDLGLNCALCLDAEMLALIAGELGRAHEAAEFAALAEGMRARIAAEFWDETRAIFANRQRGGDRGFVRALSPTSFFPLLCGAASDPQAARLLDHLADPALFAAPFVLPNASRGEPAYRDNTYWRGRVWPNVNWLVWQGLRRYGFEGEARRLAGAGFDLFRRSWETKRSCGENYGAESGLVDDGPDADPFYTWGALLPLMAVSGVMDVSPWTGWEIANDGRAVRLGPLASPAGAVSVAVEEDGWLSLVRGGATLFETDFRGRLTHLVAETGLLSMRLHPEAGAAAAPAPTLRLGADLSARLVAARLDGAPLSPAGTADGRLAFALADAPAGARLDCHLAPA